jgi:hypothetical protein
VYPYMNEDVAWRRQQDIQREIENSRIWADGSATLARAAIRLASRLWVQAMRRRPRRETTAAAAGEREAA